MYIYCTLYLYIYICYILTSLFNIRLYILPKNSKRLYYRRDFYTSLLTIYQYLMFCIGIPFNFFKLYSLYSLRNLMLFRHFLMIRGSTQPLTFIFGVLITQYENRDLQLGRSSSRFRSSHSQLLIGLFF